MTVREIRESTKLSQAKFCELYGIPKRTLEAWESGQNEPAPYLVELLKRAVEQDGEFKVVGQFNTGDEYVETFRTEAQFHWVMEKIMNNEACCPPQWIIGKIDKKFLPKYLKEFFADYRPFDPEYKEEEER